MGSMTPSTTRDAGEAEWLDGDDAGYLADTAQLRRQIFQSAGLSGEDSEVRQLMRQRRRAAAAAREAISTWRSMRRVDSLSSEYDAIRERLLHANQRADQEEMKNAADEAEVDEVGADIEAEQAEVEAVDEEVDIAELQAVVRWRRRRGERRRGGAGLRNRQRTADRWTPQCASSGGG